MNEELNQILASLADRFCERRAYKCLFRYMPAYFSPNGLTDGWELCQESLKDTRALCKGELLEDEAKDLNRAINLIDRMLAGR